jgi:acetyltransferase-like isoleucine patch superfamily enzyme
LISSTAKIYSNVKLGPECTVEDFVVLGKSPAFETESMRKLTVGPHAHFRCGTIIYCGTTIGENFVSGDYAKVREDNLIKDNVRVGSNTIIERESTVGSDVSIHSNCFIPEYTTIDDLVWIGPCVVVANVLHPPCPYFKKDLVDRPRCLKGPTFRTGSIIGAGSIVLPGVTIGERALIGAGALVASDVPSEAVVVGSPAKVVGSIRDLKCPPGYYATGEIYNWRR